MWIMSREAGFVSVVAHASDRDLLDVRAHRRRDLEGIAAVPGGRTGILYVGPPAEFAWWLTVTRMQLVLFLNREVAALDYRADVELVAGDRDLMVVLGNVGRELDGLHSEDGAPDVPARRVRVRHNRRRRRTPV